MPQTKRYFNPAQDSLGVEELDDAELDCCRPLSTDRGAATVELTRLNLARRLSSAVFPPTAAG
jgi:hypothetical protein